MKAAFEAKQRQQRQAKKAANVVVLVYAIGGKGEPHIIPNTLQAMQEIVGGYIELVRLRVGKFENDSGEYDLYCNEDGLFENLRFNRTVGEHRIHGTFFVTRNAPDDDDSGAMVSLTAEDIVQIRTRLEPNY